MGRFLGLLGVTSAMVAMVFPAPGHTQEPSTTIDDTMIIDDTVIIDDFAWVAGVWRGEGLGGVAEEIWSEPAHGEMMGSFRLFNQDGDLQFYEFFTLSKVDGTFVLRIKHFDPHLVGWEDKEESVEFPLLSVEDRVARFEGLVYSSPDANTLRATVTIGSEQGTREETFRFKRVVGVGAAGQ